MNLPSMSRRSVLAAGAACVALPSFAQPARGNGQALAVVQMYDTSTAEQDVTRDFLAGARAAWQDMNARGGLRGRPVQHLAQPVDGTPAALQAAWQSARDNPACVVLSGTAGHPLAHALDALLRGQPAELAHAAPWLQDPETAAQTCTFPIFSGRQEQIAHALTSLTVSGIREVGAVFASDREANTSLDDVARAAKTLQLRLVTWRGTTGLTQFGQSLGAATPAVLLFIGGTPELVQFTQGLERQARQRYVIALADVNLQTVHQMGGGRTAPVIATQPVPVVTAALPIVRRYREALARYFDEQPVAIGLAGFISACYTFQVLAGIEGPVTRASVRAAFDRRHDADIGGYRVSFRGARGGGSFVTQSMLTADGRVVG